MQMGMYDELQCDHPLPDGTSLAGRTFQTKDTPAQYLDLYRITADGRLIHRETDTEEVPLAERPHPDATDWRSVIGSVRLVNPRDVDTNYHGDINFYDGDEYTARFLNGQLVSISIGDMWMPEGGK